MALTSLKAGLFLTALLLLITVDAQSPPMNPPSTNPNELKAPNSCTAKISAYPDYSGSVDVGGSVRLTEQGSPGSGAINVEYALNGLIGVSTAYGLHVHTGTSCEVANQVGGHYFTGGNGDPWNGRSYDTPTSTGMTASAFSLITGHDMTANLGHAIVVHYGGVKVGCGVCVQDDAVDLGKAAQFAVLTATGITNVPSSAITGNVGSSPITGAAILVLCTEVEGDIFSVDASGPAPCLKNGVDKATINNPSMLTTAILNMGAAYTDVIGRTSPPATLNLQGGLIGGLTFLHSGLYRWVSNVLIAANIKIGTNHPSARNDVFLFQVIGTLNIATGIHVNLGTHVQSKNIYWAVTGVVVLDVSSVFHGTILAKTMIAMNTGAVLNGRALAQTAVTLQKNTITKPN